MRMIFQCVERWELTDKNPIKLVGVKGGDEAAQDAAGAYSDQFESLLPLNREPYRTIVHRGPSRQRNRGSEIGGTSILTGAHCWFNEPLFMGGSETKDRVISR
jgi:hypothetical protein